MAQLSSPLKKELFESFTQIRRKAVDVGDCKALDEVEGFRIFISHTLIFAYFRSIKFDL